MAKRENYHVDSARSEAWMKSISGMIRHPGIETKLLEKSALCVIDMQNFFVDPGSHASFPAATGIIPNINRIIEAFMGIGRPVIFTRHALTEGDDPGIMAGWWKDTVYDNTPGSRLSSELNVPDDAKVIRKTTYDAFHNTELKNILEQSGSQSVVITGVMTHLCCETTARTAFVNDIHVYFVIDATGTVNEELHLSTLRTLSDGFAVPVTTDTLLARLEDLLNGGE
jgi:nicotinamidase-related amidase